MRAKLILFAVWVIVFAGLMVIIYANAQAADEKTCAEYGIQVELLVKQLTNDYDVAQAARSRGEAYCFVIDVPPVQFKTDPPNTTVQPKSKPAPSEREIACAKRYKSFRISDGTVIPAGKKKRVSCPLLHG